MAALPEPPDPTLEAADRAIEARELGNYRRRPYLGMSSIGHACARALWYKFRWCDAQDITAAGLKRIADGHLGEAIQAGRLQAVDGIDLLTVDPETAGQYAYEDHDGHYRGHADGLIHGLLQAPRTWHVWEHKQVDDKRLARLEKLKAQLGEKAALQAWDEVYWAQAQQYMHYSNLSRHYMTVASPGGRRTVSVRTEYDREAAERLSRRAAEIIAADRPPARISDDPGFYLCGWCDAREVCHGGQMPLRHCRSCLHSTPQTQGQWYCSRHAAYLTLDEQRAGCPMHRYIPDLVPGRQSDVDGEDIVYEMPDGTTWHDRGI